MARMDPAGAESVHDGVKENLLEEAAVYRQLRPRVSGGETARFTPDLLTALGAIAQRLGRHRAALQLAKQPKSIELPRGVR